MTDEQLYCDVPDCRDPLDPDFPRPVAGHGQGKCSTHLKQLQRTGKTTTITERVTPLERVIVAASALAEAGDDDEVYEERKRALALQLRNLAASAPAVRRSGDVIQAIRAGLKRARERGARIGRPPKVNTERVLELVELLKKPALVAQVLGCHRDTVYAHLARCRKRVKVFRHRPVTRGERPRLAGGS